ncbi:hypothetical protein PTE30175_04261 [Pandoraea terrae]|uniref:Uncharacterized protein n=1 Tax=Pandoraea terrae TaxID=1537710 RepID=A0A5E4Y8Q6_9BURK|nr:hypothetical protein [Pandoraea terrae]VVE45034.1 hypothetical protein PTE30175_04261 [Pandoraea terrae]
MASDICNDTIDPTDASIDAAIAALEQQRSALTNAMFDLARLHRDLTALTVDAQTDPSAAARLAKLSSAMSAPSVRAQEGAVREIGRRLAHLSSALEAEAGLPRREDNAEPSGPSKARKLRPRLRRSGTNGFA